MSIDRERERLDKINEKNHAREKKEQEKKIREAIKEREQKQQMQTVYNDALKGLDCVSKERDKWYERYQKTKGSNSITEEMNKEVFYCTQILYAYAKQYIELFEASMAFAEMMRTFKTINKCFNNTIQQLTPQTIHKATKNSKKFFKSIMHMKDVICKNGHSLGSVFTKSDKKKNKGNEDFEFAIKSYEEEKGLAGSGDALSSSSSESTFGSGGHPGIDTD